MTIRADLTSWYIPKWLPRIRVAEQHNYINENRLPGGNKPCSVMRHMRPLYTH